MNTLKIIKLAYYIYLINNPKMLVVVLGKISSDVIKMYAVFF